MFNSQNRDATPQVRFSIAFLITPLKPLKLLSKKDFFSIKSFSPDNNLELKHKSNIFLSALSLLLINIYMYSC